MQSKTSGSESFFISKLSLGLALLLLGAILVFGGSQNSNTGKHTFANEPVVVEGFSSDEVDDSEAIAGELFRLARIAKERGEAIGIGHCRPNTLRTMKKYLPALAEAGFDLVSVSKLAH